MILLHHYIYSFAVKRNRRLPLLLVVSISALGIELILGEVKTKQRILFSVNKKKIILGHNP